MTPCWATLWPQCFIQRARPVELRSGHESAHRIEAFDSNVDTVMQGVSGRTLKLSYKGGSKEVTVPENVPVVTPIAAARSDLTVGKKVFVIANGDPNHLTAARIFVEKDGVAPPM